MIIKGFENIITLLLETFFFSAFSRLIIFFRPACFKKSLNLIEIIFFISIFLSKVKSWINSLVDNFMDLLDYEISLHFYCV